MQCPNGLYVAGSYSSESVRRLTAMIDTLSIENPVDSKDLHTTIMYSETPVEDYRDSGLSSVTLPVTPLAFEVFESDGKNVLVLLIASAHLHMVHFRIKDEYDVEYSHPTYRPHITLSYDCPNAEDYLALDPETYLGDAPLLIDSIFANDRDEDWNAMDEDDEDESDIETV